MANYGGLGDIGSDLYLLRTEFANGKTKIRVVAKRSLTLSLRALKIDMSRWNRMQLSRWSEGRRPLKVEVYKLSTSHAQLCNDKGEVIQLSLDITES